MPQPCINRSAALSVAALIVVLPLSAVSCSATQKAIDCGNNAVKISGDVADAGSAFNNADKDPAGAGRALQKLKTDLDQVGRNSSDTDVSKAVKDLQTQADVAQKALNRNQIPNAAPLADAAGRLSKACTG